MVNIQFILVGLQCKGIPITEYFIIPITNGILAYSAMQPQPTRNPYSFTAHHLSIWWFPKNRGKNPKMDGL